MECDSTVEDHKVKSPLIKHEYKDTTNDSQQFDGEVVDVLSDFPWKAYGPLSIPHEINCKVFEELRKHAQYSPSHKIRWTIYTMTPGNIMHSGKDNKPVSNPVRLHIWGGMDGHDVDEWIGVFDSPDQTVVIPA